jgi:hypothetical protein
VLSLGAMLMGSRTDVVRHPVYPRWGVARARTAASVTSAPPAPYSGQLVGCGRATYPRKPDSGHIDTISITVRIRRTSWNAGRAEAPVPRAVLGESARDKGHESLVTSSGYTARELLAVKEYAFGTDETHLLQRGGPNSELADRAAADPLIRPVGLSAWRNSTADGRVG